jgi:hypothetical protein
MPHLPPNDGRIAYRLIFHDSDIFGNSADESRILEALYLFSAVYRNAGQFVFYV